MLIDEWIVEYKRYPKGNEVELTAVFDTQQEAEINIGQMREAGYAAQLSHRYHRLVIEPIHWTHP